MGEDSDMGSAFGGFLEMAEPVEKGINTGADIHERLAAGGRDMQVVRSSQRRVVSVDRVKPSLEF